MYIDAHIYIDALQGNTSICPHKDQCCHVVVLRRSNLLYSRVLAGPAPPRTRSPEQKLNELSFLSGSALLQFVKALPIVLYSFSTAWSVCQRTYICRPQAVISSRVVSASTTIYFVDVIACMLKRAFAYGGLRCKKLSGPA